MSSNTVKPTCFTNFVIYSNYIRKYLGFTNYDYKKVDLNESEQEQKQEQEQEQEQENKKEQEQEQEQSNINLKVGISQDMSLANNLKQSTMEELCLKMFVRNMHCKLFSNMLINICMCSLIIPLMFKLYNNNLLDNNSNIYKSLFYIGLATGCEIFSTIHKNIIIEPEKRKFVTMVHCDLEDEVNSHVLQIDWNKLRELNKNDLERKKHITKLYLLGFINYSITTFISLFSFFGYLYWIGLICPITILVYLVIMCLMVKYYSHKVKNVRDENHILTNKYYNLQTGLFTDIIHLQGKATLNKMKEYICEIENKRDESKKADSIYIDTINVVYNISFIFNCIIVMYLVSSISDIVIYIQYSCLMKSSVISCIGLYTYYKETKQEYEKLVNIISSCVERKKLKQELEFFQIEVESLEYTYSRDVNEFNIPFKLKLQEQLKLRFKLGEIVKLEGDSGHGKSTFSDIVNGIIPFNEYTSTIKIEKNDNSLIQIKGFDALTKIRYYNEQLENICWKPSVYEIVSGEDLIFDSEKNLINYNHDIESKVWKALSICSCGDFLKLENNANKLKWIYTPNIGMSGGQKGRVGLARTIFRIIKNKPKFITLDEVDKSIQSEMVVGIMKEIFHYAKINGILMFIIAHTEQVKKLDGVYDQVINFNKGIISQYVITQSVNT